MNKLITHETVNPEWVLVDSTTGHRLQVGQQVTDKAGDTFPLYGWAYMANVDTVGTVHVGFEDGTLSWRPDSINAEFVNIENATRTASALTVEQLVELARKKAADIPASEDGRIFDPSWKVRKSV